MVDLGLIFRIFQFFTGFYWKWGFWCIPTPDDCDQHPGRGLFFFFESHFFGKNMIFSDFSMIFHQNDPKMIPKRGIIARTGILDPIEFWWVA